MTGQEKIISLGMENSSYDWGLPQEWYNEVLYTTGQNPAGHIVWLYDSSSGIFGRPYSITLKGYQLMRIHELHRARGTTPQKGGDTV
jgi:hypothetical protein